MRYQGKVHLKIKAPNAVERAPVDIVLVIDKSGSMGTIAKVKDISGNSVEYGLTILDVVKHAVRTVISMLNPNDRVSIIAYDDDATDVFTLSSMNDSNKQTCISKLEQITPGTSTNLWGGLHSALMTMTQNRIIGRNASVLFFTDGVPNIRPARPESQMFARFNIENNTNFSVHFYGFGYSMESQLLNDCANVGSGSYCFIPDASFVGTIFTNAVANILSTCADNIKLQINNGSVCGEYRDSEGWVDVGPIMYGQTRDVVIECDTPLHVHISYHSFGQLVEIAYPLTNMEIHEHTPRFKRQLVRLSFIQVIQQCIHNPLNATDFIKDMATQISTNPEGREYLRDLSGQILEAFTGKGYFDKWGRHYVRSIVRTHQLQQRNNFKDFSVQHYGSEMSRLLADQAEELFNVLAPPRPSALSSRSASMNSMHIMNISNAPCFSGDCYAKMTDSSIKILSDLKKGDSIWTPFGSATIRCVVKTTFVEGGAQLVHLENNLMVTPWHPIVYNEKWVFPIHISSPTFTHIKSVYSFVLDKHHIMDINGYSAICLGHTYTDNPILKHPYFGSNAVIRDLSNMRGWNKGFVELNSGCMRREKGVVVAMVQQN